MEQERTPILNLRTSGTTAPSTSLIEDGEIAISMDNTNPKLWTKKNDGSLAEFIDKLGTIGLMSGKEDTSNKVSSVSSASTETEYPSAKAVNTLVENKLSNVLRTDEIGTISAVTEDCVMVMRDNEGYKKVDVDTFVTYIDDSTNRLAFEYDEESNILNITGSRNNMEYNPLTQILNITL